MIRWSLCAMIVATAMAAEVAAIDFWLSDSATLLPGSDLPAGASAVPTFHHFASNSSVDGSLYLWGRPDASETLENWSLRLVAENGANFMTFATPMGEQSATAVAKANLEAYNDKVDQDATDRVRWEHVAGVPGIVGFNDNRPQISLFGFTLFNLSRTGTGIGPTCTADDLFCDATTNSWLLGKVDYRLDGNTGVTPLFLQIGERGINHLGELIDDSEVRFGDAGEATLNGDADQLVSSTNPDGLIRVHSALSPTAADFTCKGFGCDPDQDVDGHDFLTWQFYRDKGGNVREQGDANGDGQVDKIDLAAWRFQYGTDTNGAAALSVVPEPSTAAFVAVTFVLGLVRRNAVRDSNRPATGE